MPKAKKATKKSSTKKAKIEKANSKMATDGYSQEMRMTLKRPQ